MGLPFRKRVLITVLFYLEQPGITMPPWDVGAAEISIIGMGNNLTTRVTSTSTAATTTTTEQTSTDMELTTGHQGPLNVTLILGELTTEDLSSMTICKLAAVYSGVLVIFVSITGFLESIFLESIHVDMYFDWSMCFKEGS